MKVAEFWIQRKWRHTRECTKSLTPWFSLHFSVIFKEKKPSIKFYGVFNHFSWTYEVKKVWMNKLHFDVSDIIHSNKHTKYANCDLHFLRWKKNCFFGLKSSLKGTSVQVFSWAFAKFVRSTILWSICSKDVKNLVKYLRWSFLTGFV